MTIFDVLSLIGGLCLFLFGMNFMGESLERRAGSSLKMLLGKLTQSRLAGFLTGLGVTAVIQSSSATTVMVVGFVNSGIMTLRQAINVIMGANVGTTITAWILSLGGIDGSNVFVKLLKPTSFTPILALIGIFYYMSANPSKKKDTGAILLGFATLMFGMNAMSKAVEGLADVPSFQQMFIMFQNPILGVLVGALLTAIIQSSSASVGILQALSSTGAVTNGAALPIIMGQNIGTCITAILSSFGTNKNAKRAAIVHLAFNIIGTVILLTVFWVISAIFKPAIFAESADHFSIAIAHTVFNVACTIILFPMASLLEKLANKLVPDTKKNDDAIVELDERLLVTPAIALDRCSKLTLEMADVSFAALKSSLTLLKTYDAQVAEDVRAKEEKADHYEDILGTYLVKLSSHQLTDTESAEAANLLKTIGDFERISDHSINVIESAEELRDKEINFSAAGEKEMNVFVSAVAEILDLTLNAYVNNDVTLAKGIEPLEQVIDDLKAALRNAHIKRLQKGECSIEAGFVWADLINNLERTADHCSNIAVGIIDSALNNMNVHESLRELRSDNTEFREKYQMYTQKYSIA